MRTRIDFAARSFFPIVTVGERVCFICRKRERERALLLRDNGLSVVFDGWHSAGPRNENNGKATNKKPLVCLRAGAEQRKVSARGERIDGDLEGLYLDDEAIHHARETL